MRGQNRSSGRHQITLFDSERCSISIEHSHLGPVHLPASRLTSRRIEVHPSIHSGEVRFNYCQRMRVSISVLILEGGRQRLAGLHNEGIVATG